jgi:magnesium-transporting ATPase (P-type)
MITGDHVHTGIHIGRIAGLIRRDQFGTAPVVYIADANASKNIVWHDAEDGKEIAQLEVESMVQRSRAGGQPVELAVTGKAFKIFCRTSWMRDHLLGKQASFFLIRSLRKRQRKSHGTSHV